MRKDNINYFLVGCFVLGMLGILLVALYKITGHRGETDAYLVRFDNINGINPSTVVTYEGFPIGHVGHIRPMRADGRTRYDVELLVKRDWQIPEDSRARIMSVSLLSDFTVDIREGKSTTYIASGGVLEGEELTDVFAIMADVAADVGSLTEQGVKPLLDTLNRRVDLLGARLEESVPSLLKRSEGILAKLDSSADALQEMLGSGNLAHVNNLLRNADDFSANMLRLTRDLEQTRGEFDQLLQKSNTVLTEATPDLQRSVVQLRGSLEVIAQHIDEIVANLTGASRNMQEFSRQLRNNPGLLLGGSAPKDTGKGAP